MMNNFIEIFEQIKRRPTLFLSRKSIFDFQSFYYGYGLAKQQFNLQKTEEDLKFDNFLLWLRQRYNIETTQSWASLVLFHSVDEADALERLFKLWEDYQNIDDQQNNNTEVALNENNLVSITF